MSRTLKISFGGRHHAVVEKVRELTWEQFGTWLVKQPPESNDKESRGWYSCAIFSEDYRYGDNFISRDALTFDFDHVDENAFAAVSYLFRNVSHAIYTTWSHKAEGKGDRFRLVVPLSRPVSYDEFQAISRKVGERIGIEMVAGESHVPAQFMYQPLRRPGAEFLGDLNTTSPILEADVVLAQYIDWTDRSSWPRRASGDNPSDPETICSPLDKPGLVGDFCRAFRISEAIRRFELPYIPTSTEGRWTYTAGSRPEGAIVYDQDTKLHSHHDTDPARGQVNAFDLVRAHRFADLDRGVAADTAITERPSYRAMCQLVMEQPEVQVALAAENFTDLGPAPPGESDFTPLAESDVRTVEPSATLARHISDVLRNPTSPRWLLRDELEWGVIAIMAGPRGSYKSFLALNWSMRTAVAGHAVYVISAEGGDFDRRARAWLMHFAPEHGGKRLEDLPLYVVERRLDLSAPEPGINAIRADCIALKIRPKLFVLDTFSKLSGGLDENENTAVKQFIGKLDNGLKRAETAFDATVLVVAHTGHSDAGRPRGASALGADTDAEYIVSRSEGSQTVTMTRERFKASPELPPLTYRAASVNLGYHDDQGNEVTSLVMLPAEPERKSKGIDGKPMGDRQQLVWKVLHELDGDVQSVVAEVLLTEVCKRLPDDTGADTGSTVRRSGYRQALYAMIGKGVVFSHPGNKVALFEVPVAEPEAWLQ